MSMPVAAVTGATGVIGPALVSRLLEAGYRVRALARRPEATGSPVAPAEVHGGDICDAVAVGRLVAGADVVIHLAAMLHRSDPPPELHEEYRRVNVEGTRTVVRCAVEAGVGRLVYASTVTVYGPTAGRTLDEDAPPRPDTVYARTKLDGERIALAARSARTGGPLAVALRLATVYGPRQKGYLERLVRALARGRFMPVGDGRNRRTLVYERDAAEALALAARHPAAPGRVFNVTDGDTHTMRDLLGIICRALGRSPVRWHVPLPVAQAGAAGAEWICARFGRPAPLTRAMLDKYVEDAAYSGRRIQADLGFRPACDLGAGWRQTVAALRERGAL